VVMELISPTDSLFLWGGYEHPMLSVACNCSSRRGHDWFMREAYEALLDAVTCNPPSAAARVNPRRNQ
jgi:hypothetical protein